MLSRRSMLTVCAGIITTGCLENNQSISEVALDSVIVRNLDDTAHTLQSEIERNGEVIVNKTIEVSARSDGRKSLAVLGEIFPKTPAEYHIFATLEGSNTEISTELGAVQESNCINAEIRIITEEDLEVWMGSSSTCGKTEKESD